MIKHYTEFDVLAVLTSLATGFRSFRQKSSIASANWSLRSPATMWRAPLTST